MKQKILNYTFIFFSLIIFTNILGVNNFINILNGNSNYNSSQNSLLDDSENNDTRADDVSLTDTQVFQSADFDEGTVKIIFIYSDITTQESATKATLLENETPIQETNDFSSNRSGEFIVNDLTPKETYDSGYFSVRLYSTSSNTAPASAMIVPEFTVQEFAFFTNIENTASDYSIKIDYQINLGYINDKNSYSLNSGESVKLYENSGEEPVLMGEDFNWELDKRANIISGSIVATGLNESTNYNFYLQADLISGNYLYPTSSEIINVSTTSSFPKWIWISILLASILVILLLTLLLRFTKKKQEKKARKITNALN